MNSEPTAETEHPQGDRAHWREVLRQHGLRYSRARALILQSFQRPDNGHLSAEELHSMLAAAGEDISLSTVYLNLAVLRDAGLLTEFRGTNGKAVFDANAEPHYHVICTETGEIHDLPQIDVDGVPLGAYLRSEIKRRTGWDVEEPVISLKGRRR